MDEKVTVYVDPETFYNLVLEGENFEAMLWEEGDAKIAITIEWRQILSTNDRDMVEIWRRR